MTPALNDLKRAGDFTVDTCKLTLSSGVELDISGVLLEVQLYEDIDTPSVTGTVSFVNTDGLSNSGPIIGQEYLKLKIRTPTFEKEENIIDFTENVLHVTNVTVSQVGNKGELILMNVITSEAVRNQGAVVSRSVKGTYDQFVETLLKSDLKCTKKLDIEASAGLRKYVLPNTNPFDLIKIFRRKAVSFATNSPTYVFFENFRGYHFKTLEKMYEQKPVMTYFESSFGADIGPDINADIGEKNQKFPKERLERELSTIQAASIINRKDTLVNMSLGALSSELTTFDVVTKQFNGGNGPETPFVYNYFDDRKKEKHINDFDKESTGDNPIYSEVTSENKRISDSVHVDFLSFTATIPNGDGSGQTITRTTTSTPAQIRENRSNFPAEVGHGPAAATSGGNGSSSSIELASIGRGHRLRKDAAEAYLRMVAAATKDGISWGVTSSYRSVAKQRELFEAEVKKRGSVAKARKWVAPPGNSAHNKGLAVDIHELYSNRKNFKNNPVWKWLTANGPKYKFKQSMTWEPWHWEYTTGKIETGTEDETESSAGELDIGASAQEEVQTPVQQIVQIVDEERDALHEGAGSYVPIKTDEWLQRRRSFMVNLHSGIGLNLRVNGNTKVSAGDIVIVNLRSPLIDKGERVDPKDRYFRGNFLVTKIEHTFKLSNDKHEMQMTVMKDSMESPLPGGVNEEPRSVQQGNPEQTTSDSRTPAQKRKDKVGGGAVSASRNQKEMIEKFENDSEFQEAWKRLKAKHPQVEKAEFYRVIFGESRGKHTAVYIDKETGERGAVGLFQFTGDTAKGLGKTKDEILRMTPAQQVDLYSNYLNGPPRYRGGGFGSLSVFGAAPAFHHMPDDTVAYAVGSKGWNKNPWYRPADNGPITVGSLKNFLANKNSKYAKG